jgi:chromate transporter
VARLTEVAGYFIRLGVVGFGGPNAHIAAMHDDLVRRRGWLDDRHFLDVVGVTNLIPGPNSSEVAIHIGYLRGGLAGGLVAGLCFLFPAFLMVLALSWAYFEAGGFRLREELLAGIQPVALAAILVTAWRLRSAVVGGWRKPVVGALAFGLTLWIPPAAPLVILGAGLANLAATRSPSRLGMWLAVPLAAVAPSGGLGAVAWVFLRTGLLLFGGGLVLVALLAPEVVGRGWLTRTEFLDGIALGQATPGPITMSAAFVGYAVEGVLGAVVATTAIYLPSFLAVLAGSGPFLRRFRENPSVSAFVEGVTAAALGSVVAAAVLLAAALEGWFGYALLAVSAVVLLLRVPVVLVVLGGGLVGLGAGLLGLV